MSDGTWRVRAYIEYELEASNEEKAIQRMAECFVRDIEDGAVDIREIAEVNAEKISDDRIEE